VCARGSGCRVCLYFELTAKYAKYAKEERVAEKGVLTCWVADLNKAEGVRALETGLAESLSWPEVRQAFQNAFALYRQHKTGATEGTST
jgi:hypothetical protein